VGFVKPKVLTDNVWIVEITMPRKYVDNTIQDYVNLGDEDFIDTDAFNSATQIQADAQLNANPQPVMPDGEDL
jgi:hypothetical protein